MIKKHTLSREDLATCDTCGEGMGLATLDETAIDRFIQEHKICKKEKNNNLQFLSTEKEFKKKL